MILRRIEIKNFRSYYDVKSIDFDDRLTLIVGDNGEGKTTLYSAIEWLFGMSKTTNLEHFISKKLVLQMVDFSSDEVRVTLNFEHDGEKIVERKFSFDKRDGKIITGQSICEGWEMKGSERVKCDGDHLLSRCFESSIRKYCLFKGEDNLSAFKEPAALQYLLNTFSDIKQFDRYYNDKSKNGDDSLGFTNFAEEESRKIYKKASSADETNSKEKKDLEAKIEQGIKNITILEGTIKSLNENIQKFQTEINNLENNDEVAVKVNKINDTIKKYDDQIAELNNKVITNFTTHLLDDNWILCGVGEEINSFNEKVADFSFKRREIENEELKKQAKEEVWQEIANDFVPLPKNQPNEASMREMIDAEFCKVCGRPAPKDSEPYNFMLHKLQDLLNENKKKEATKSELVNNFTKELESEANRFDYEKNMIDNLYDQIIESVQSNQKYKDTILELQSKIDSENQNKVELLAQASISEDALLNGNTNYKTWLKKQSDAKVQIQIKKAELTREEKDLAENQEKYDKLNANSETASTPQKIYYLFKAISSAFKQAKETNTRNFIDLLNNTANHYLEILNVEDFTGRVEISVDSVSKSLSIYLKDVDGSIIVEPNEALETTMYMSVLFAVSEITTNKKDNDYPLVFDAPTSSFGPLKESVFFNTISSINKQCIIVSKSFIDDKGNLLYDKIETLKCRIYQIKRVRPFKQHDLSTIETLIEEIK